MQQVRSRGLGVGVPCCQPGGEEIQLIKSCQIFQELCKCVDVLGTRPRCCFFSISPAKAFGGAVLGMPVPKPSGAAGRCSGRELGSSVFWEHQEGDGAVPRLFSLWIKSRSCKKGRFCSVTAEGKARGVTWWLSSAESLSEPWRGEKDKQLLCCCPAGCCLSAQFGAKSSPSVG